MTKMKGLGVVQGQGWLGARVRGMGWERWERLTSSGARIGAGCGGTVGEAMANNHSAPFRAVRRLVCALLIHLRVVPRLTYSVIRDPLLREYVNPSETPATACRTWQAAVCFKPTSTFPRITLR